MPLMYSSLYVGLVSSSVVSVTCDNYCPETAISTQRIMILQHPKNYILEVLLEAQHNTEPARYTEVQMSKSVRT